MKMHPYVQDVIDRVSARNAGETLFLQALHEVMESLSAVIEKHPEFVKSKMLDRICEPERQILFRVVWQDDRGDWQVNRGLRVHFSSVLGPYKGGLRFHPTVNASMIKFLGFEQIFKNSLTGLQIGGGKGGSDFDPKGKSDDEVMRFCQSFMTELYRHVGPNTDVPAGDIGVGGREIGYLFGQYKRLTNRCDLGVLTGKGDYWGGSLARKEATGYGCVYFAQEMLATKGADVKGKTCLVSGSGNVALYAIQKLQQLGANVVSCSDSNGYIYDPQGIDFNLLRDLKEVKRERLTKYHELRKGSTYKANAKVWDIPCDMAFPCACENEIGMDEAKMLVKNGCKLVAEGANMPTHNDAIKYFLDQGVLFGPAKAANAGGVAVSALEMQQNACWSSWTFDEVDNKLKGIMKRIHKTCLDYADAYGQKGNYVYGANVGGFMRVARAMTAFGAV